MARVTPGVLQATQRCNGRIGDVRNHVNQEGTIVGAAPGTTPLEVAQGRQKTAAAALLESYVRNPEEVRAGLRKELGIREGLTWIGLWEWMDLASRSFFMGSR
jgi:hypothetical protein